MNEDIIEIYIHVMKKKCIIEYEDECWWYSMYGNDNKRYLSYGAAGMNSIIRKYGVK